MLSKIACHKLTQIAGSQDQGMILCRKVIEDTHADARHPISSSEHACVIVESIKPSINHRADIHGVMPDPKLLTKQSAIRQTLRMTAFVGHHDPDYVFFPNRLDCQSCCQSAIDSSGYTNN